ncbi:hypothetical protein WN55_01212 [Dufourea novaeangliae]|uniref:Uncharacterized protein n=1 Tax=Dufourea novaeangliae TaxID=178035 RepID=A0A154NWM3_DUFNO|nr:hypothetical protein WN55_01212 [Dufourea novaeangliae]
MMKAKIKETPEEGVEEERGRKNRTWDGGDEDGQREDSKELERRMAFDICQEAEDFLRGT